MFAVARGNHLPAQRGIERADPVLAAPDRHRLAISQRMQIGEGMEEDVDGGVELPQLLMQLAAVRAVRIHEDRQTPRPLLVENRVAQGQVDRSEEHTSELQSPTNLVCRLLLEKKKKQ